MDVKQVFVSLVLFPCLLFGQIQFPQPGQYGPPVSNDLYQQQIPIHQQQQQPQINQQQQPQLNQQQPQINQQQIPIQQQQQPQLNQQQPQLNQQHQPQLNQQQGQMNQQVQMSQQSQMNQQQQQQQQQYPMNQQPQQQQYQMNQQGGGMLPNQQQYYQGNYGGFQSPSGQGYQPPPLANQFQQPSNPAAQPPSGPAGPIEKYLVGNLSEPFTFAVAPPSTKVTYIGLNGYSLYINNVGFSNRSKFSYDEQNNRLTVHSLDPTTVGYYTAVDTNWQTFVNILSAINVSSLQIHNSHSDEENNGSSLVACSVSILRSLFKLPELPSSAARPSSTGSGVAGTENLPRLDLFFSTRTPSSTLPNNKLYNDTVNGQVVTRTILSQRPLTRGDHNGTIRCQIESTNNIDVFLSRDVPINIAYGPNLEAGAIPTTSLQTEALLPISLDCQIEANPEPSYVWYEIINNNNNNLSSNGMMAYYGQQNPYGGQYPLQPQGNVPTAGLSVFGTTRQIQRIYQNPGSHAMQCQAQSRGKTVKQHFLINVNPSLNGLNGLNGATKKGKSYKFPMIIGLVLGGICLILLVAIVAAALIFIKRRRAKSAHSRSPSMEKISTDKTGKTGWGSRGNLPAENSNRYKKDVLRGDTSSTSHLVESAESQSGPPPLPPPIPSRGSPMTSTHSSYRQAAVAVPLNYNQASSLPGFRPLPPQRSYSPEADELEEDESHFHAVPVPSNRSRPAPFGSRKSLTESIQSLKSNQQSALQLPTKRRAADPPAPLLPKREEKSASPKSSEGKREFQHHHYHNPGQLRAQQRGQPEAENSSEEEDFAHQHRFDESNEDAAEAGPSTALPGRKQQSARRLITPPPPQKMVVHHPSGGHQDEAPPSYQQVALPSAPANPYAYQEPTEV